jgi:iron-sulfur cluster repair protein YtfE (RIC family)
VRFLIPSALQAEHDRLHAKLQEAAREPAPIGDIARQVADLLHPHFVKEEQFALPPLGLLSELAHGTITREMEDVLPMTARLTRELDAMLDEHRQIVDALEKLRSVARSAGRSEYEEFADALIMHAQSEEQILYPAAILVGEYVELRLRQG